MKIELSSREDKITVLKRKKKLLESISFKGVFLRSAQSHVERLIQLNFKTREGFLRKNIVAVSFFQNCAIHQYS